ncbi:hypothetical protein [Desulfospira joergensenii]|uniref:hypothetical protein n=1 Tax=Desulfospira joergensenii TaxID=53329 RepID=UPI0003B557D0|nr:hypothetical protein [Desulfospira joergensenii]
MKGIIKRLMRLLIYLFTPEDSSGPVRYGILSLAPGPARPGPASAKVLIWMLNACVLSFLLSLL